MKSNHALMILPTAIVLLWSSPLRAGWPDEYWSGWRPRQRAELAALSKPPDPPPGKGSPVDRLLAADWTKVKFSPPDPVDDAAFVRRVYLDVVGLLPTT